MEIDENFYMNLTLNFAWESQLLALSNPSVAAMIVDKNGKILALESHCKNGTPHAELQALKTAFIALQGKNYNLLQSLHSANEIYDFLLKNHSGIFCSATMFVTLEPCNHYGKTPPCAEILKALRLKSIVISASENGALQKGGAENLAKSGICVKSEVLEREGQNLLYPFLCLRDNGSLRLFKLAMRLNNSFENGIISCEESRIFSHKLRNLAQRIIISTKTILSDNPTLDARLVNGKAPDVCIFGKKNLEKCKDENLRIFSIKNRKVSFHSDIDSTLQGGFSIIEGGAEAFSVFKNHIDLLLLFISPKISQGRNFWADFNGEILHTQRLGEDALLWIKPR